MLLEDLIELSTRYGFKMAPARHMSKLPATAHGVHDATDDKAKLEAWHATSGDCNWLISGEGMLILDVDVRNDGPASLLDMEIERGALPRTLTTATPTGGQHFFFRLPEGHPGVTNKSGGLGSGLDVKSTGGYVISPGSKVEAGQYRLDVVDEIAPAPEWLVQLCGVFTKREQPKNVDIPDAMPAVMDRAYDWLRTQPAGDEAFKTACGLRDMGVSEHQAYLLMLAHDGRGPEIIAEKVRHAYAYAKNAPGVKAVTPEMFDVVGPASPRVEKPTVSDFQQPAVAGPTRLSDFVQRIGAGPGYLIKGVLSRKSYAMVYGASGEGKTFVTLDMAYSVAAGVPWMGHKVKQAPVVVVGYEAFGGLPQRAAALRAKYGNGDVPLYFMPGRDNIREPAGAQAFAQALAQMPEQPGLIVMDTMAYALMGGDENSAQDIGNFNTAIQNLIRATGVTVLLVHHTGKDPSKGARGSSAIRAALDTEIEVGGRQITATKQRDVELGQAVTFRLAAVGVGMDEDGDVITSCYVEQVATAAASNQVTASMRPGSDIKRGWEKLIEIRPDNGPVHQDEWERECAEFLPKGVKGHKTFYDIKTRLKERKLIEINNDGVVQRRME